MKDLRELESTRCKQPGFEPKYLYKEGAWVLRRNDAILRIIATMGDCPGAENWDHVSVCGVQPMSKFRFRHLS